MVKSSAATPDTSSAAPKVLEGRDARGATGRRRASALVAGLSLTLFLLGLIVPAPAGAIELGPSAPVAGGLYNSTVSCSDYWNQVRITTDVSVQTGFTNGQWVAVRYYVSDGRSSFWTGWATSFVTYNAYRTTAIVDATNYVANGGNYSVYAEIMWHNGSSWATLRGQWAQRGQALSYYTSWNGFCFT